MSAFMYGLVGLSRDDRRLPAFHPAPPAMRNLGIAHHVPAGATRVRLVESGFETLTLSDQGRTVLQADHTGGWAHEIEELGTYDARGAG